MKMNIIKFIVYREPNRQTQIDIPYRFALANPPNSSNNLRFWFPFAIVFL